MKLGETESSFISRGLHCEGLNNELVDEHICKISSSCLLLLICIMYRCLLESS